MVQDVLSYIKKLKFHSKLLKFFIFEGKIEYYGSS